MVKKLRKNSILLIIAVLIIFLCASLTAQYQKDLRNDAPPITEHYIRMSGVETLLTWSIASLREEPYITDLYVDAKNSIHFAYYDNILNTAVYVTGKDGKFSRTLLDDNRDIGGFITLATNENNIHTAYNRGSRLLYANNNGGSFNNYAMDLTENKKIIDLKLAISAFYYPTLFFINSKGVLSVSRFYRDNFFTDFVYTNNIVDSVYPVAEKDGYALFIRDYQTGNIFYGSRKTNTAFRFFDDKAIVTNSDIYTVIHEEHNRFNVLYTTKDNKNTINYMRFYHGSFSNGILVEDDKNIISLDAKLNYGFEVTALYLKEDGNKSLFMDGRIIDLSVLGTSKGNIKVAAAQYPYFYLLYYNDIFQELRVTKINISDVEKLK